MLLTEQELFPSTVDPDTNKSVIFCCNLRTAITWPALAIPSSSSMTDGILYDKVFSA